MKLRTICRSLVPLWHPCVGMLSTYNPRTSGIVAKIRRQAFLLLGPHGTQRRNSVVSGSCSTPNNTGQRSVWVPRRSGLAAPQDKATYFHFLLVPSFQNWLLILEIPDRPDAPPGSRLKATSNGCLRSCKHLQDRYSIPACIAENVLKTLRTL